MKQEIERNILRHACGMKITCACGAVLDARRAVLGTSADDSSFVACVSCWENKIPEWARTEFLDGEGNELLDGRELW